MSICPITYEEIPSKHRYSLRGLRKISSKFSQEDLQEGLVFPYTQDQQREKSVSYQDRLSIQGHQYKFSVRFSPKTKNFIIVEKGGEYIFKPASDRHPFLPENESLTMKMAEVFWFAGSS